MTEPRKARTTYDNGDALVAMANYDIIGDCILIYGGWENRGECLFKLKMDERDSWPGIVRGVAQSLGMDANQSRDFEDTVRMAIGSSWPRLRKTAGKGKPAEQQTRKTNMIPKTCQNCHFYQPGPGAKWGWCKIDPPILIATRTVPIENGQDQVIGIFNNPVTNPISFCGQWECRGE